jgi:hypothetical protein
MINVFMKRFWRDVSIIINRGRCLSTFFIIASFYATQTFNQVLLLFGGLVGGPIVSSLLLRLRYFLVMKVKEENLQDFFQKPWEMCMICSVLQNNKSGYYSLQYQEKYL